jgi:hypothetical protein
MDQTVPKNGTRLPKLELQLNQTVTLTLVKDKAYTGESAYGPYFLYATKDPSGTEFSFFAPADVHQQILESGLKAGDSFQLTKRAVQNGKKVSAKIEFEAAKKNGAAPALQEQKQEEVPFEVPDDEFKQLMQRCVQEAVEIVKEVNTIPWQNEDVRSIALTMFIQRSRA